MNCVPKDFTVKQLVEAFKAGSLLRNDDYQRGEQWSEVQKAVFIDSIFRAYPVPPLFLNVVESAGLDNTPVREHEIVDGQPSQDRTWLIRMSGLYRSTTIN
jgi:uncharacterized protein with ParB-like and HNH nuclease domain